jgi:hypothetical protein
MSHSLRHSAGPYYHPQIFSHLTNPPLRLAIYIEGTEQRSRHMPVVTHVLSRLCSEALNVDKTLQVRRAPGPDISHVFGRL